MNHVTDRLDDLIDGRLDPATETGVREHLAACKDCNAAEARLRALLDAAQKLSRSIDPPLEVWTAVRARTIDVRAQRRALLWSLRWPLTAAAAVLVLLTSALTALILHERAPATTVVVTEPGTVVALTAAEQEYDRVARELEATLAAHASRMDTTTARIVAENLQIIDRAIAEARAALARNPNNPNLGRLISTSYQRKIQMLERTLRLSATS